MSCYEVTGLPVCKLIPSKHLDPLLKSEEAEDA